MPRLTRLFAPEMLALAVSALGLALRIEHAMTFDGRGRGADYGVHIQGIQWMLENRRPFYFDPSVEYQVSYQPPLWFAIGAIIYRLTNSERAIASLAVLGWTMRQFLLGRVLREVAPRARWSRLAALSVHAVIPLSVMMDGEVNPEGLHSGLFMLGLYVLFQIERQANTWTGVKTQTAIWFAIVAGLALLTKATSSMLIVTAAIMLGWRAGKMLLESGWRDGVVLTWQRIVRPMAVAGCIYLVVVGWWSATNVRDRDHPFPHPWDLEGPAQHEELALPLMYRRPLGWALPTEWGDYLSFPVIGEKHTPNPNFWAYTVIGTWTDLYNRGFCRLKGGGETDMVWGGNLGFMPQGPGWSVSGRCIKLFSSLAWVGLPLTLATVFAVFRTAWGYLRSGGHEDSLVLPLASLLVVFFVFLFALKYPFDYIAVVNPKYLLCAMAPMAACFGLWLSHFREGSAKWRIAHYGAFAAIGIIALLLVRERLGR